MTAVKEKGNEYECIFECDVAAYLWNADRDSRTQNGSDEREEQEVTINDTRGERDGCVEHTCGAGRHDQPHVNFG